MPLFTSSREKRLWLYALIVFVAILSTLALGRPLQEMLIDQNIQGIVFMLGMILTGVTIIIHGLKTQTSKTEIIIWLGLAAVYLLFFLRLGLPERSHLIEYSVLAIFIHMALIERVSQGDQALMPALLAFAATLIIGILDECIQIFLPDRVFDPNDMLFNGLAGLMAIGSRMVLQWVRKKKSKS
jgi:hypothetical protein